MMSFMFVLQKWTVQIKLKWLQNEPICHVHYVLSGSLSCFPIRIECFSSGIMGNVNPVLTFDAYEGPLALTSTPTIDSRYIDFDWLNHRASIAILGGLPQQNYGLYTCRTETATIQHYIVNCEFIWSIHVNNIIITDL